jgi:hypothetical protein
MNMCVNYIWMNKDPEVLEPIPSHFFRRLQDNAETYPDTPFQLWLQDDRAHDDYYHPPNVSVFKLTSIPRFSQSPIINSQIEPIWPKVDIARLHVVEHALTTQKYDTAVYADFDVPDVSLNLAGLNTRLDLYGVALGGTFDPTNGELMLPFHNGYLAFRQQAVDLLDYVIDHIERKKRSGKNRSKVFFAMVGALHACAGSSRTFCTSFPKDWVSSVASLPVAPPPLWRGDSNLKAKPASSHNQSNTELWALQPPAPVG